MARGQEAQTQHSEPLARRLVTRLLSPSQGAATSPQTQNRSPSSKHAIISPGPLFIDTSAQGRS